MTARGSGHHNQQLFSIQQLLIRQDVVSVSSIASEAAWNVKQALAAKFNNYGHS